MGKWKKGTKICDKTKIWPLIPAERYLAEITSTLMLLAKVSHIGRPDVTSMGEYNPSADSEEWLSRWESAEGNRAREVAQRQMMKGPGHVPVGWGFILWAGSSH